MAQEHSVTIIGLSGTNGSGKDTLGVLLAEKYNFLFVSLTDILRVEARLRGMVPNREALRTISTEWRREHGLGVLVERAVDSFIPVKDQYSGLVMASLRNPAEADTVHTHNGLVVWTDGDPKVRFERIQSNRSTRDRAAEDDITFEEFLAHEQAEMHHTGDKATLNMSGVRDKSDLVLINDGNSIADFKLQAEVAVQPFLNSKSA